VTTTTLRFMTLLSCMAFSGNYRNQGFAGIARMMMHATSTTIAGDANNEPIRITAWHLCPNLASG
jgi:ATP-dependent protease ClpP protease subunit